MANWDETIHISNLHRLYTAGGIDVRQLCKGIVIKLQTTHAFAACAPELTDIVCVFESVANDPFACQKDYEAALDMLYLFADEGYKMWIDAESPFVPGGDDSIPFKVRNPFNEEKTEPGSIPLHSVHHTPYKEPYISPLILAPAEPQPEAWDKHRLYQIGVRVIRNTLQYQCMVSNANSDPECNSSHTGVWKYVGAVQSNVPVADAITCQLGKGRTYASTRPYHYMTEEDFNKKLKFFEIVPGIIPKELYTYMKNADEPYQEWLISRWIEQKLMFRKVAITATME